MSLPWPGRSRFGCAGLDSGGFRRSFGRGAFRRRSCFGGLWFRRGRWRGHDARSAGRPLIAKDNNVGAGSWRLSGCRWRSPPGSWCRPWSGSRHSAARRTDPRTRKSLSGNRSRRGQRSWPCFSDLDGHSLWSRPSAQAWSNRLFNPLRTGQGNRSARFRRHRDVDIANASIIRRRSSVRCRRANGVRHRRHAFRHCSCGIYLNRLLG